MGDAQDMEMEGSSDYDEENSSQISSNITHHTSKKQQNEDNRHGKSNDSNNQNGTSGGKKKNRALLLAQQNSATDRLSNRELNKIKQQIDRLEHQNKRNKKKREYHMKQSEKKSPESDCSPSEHRRIGKETTSGTFGDSLGNQGKKQTSSKNMTEPFQLGNSLSAEVSETPGVVPELTASSSVGGAINKDNNHYNNTDKNNNNNNNTSLSKSSLHELTVAVTSEGSNKIQIRYSNIDSQNSNNNSITNSSKSAGITTNSIKLPKINENNNSMNSNTMQIALSKSNDNSNGMGIIVTEDDSEVSASCDHFDEEIIQNKDEHEEDNHKNAVPNTQQNESQLQKSPPSYNNNSSNKLIVAATNPPQIHETVQNNSNNHDTDIFQSSNDAKESEMIAEVNDLSFEGNIQNPLESAHKQKKILQRKGKDSITAAAGGLTTKIIQQQPGVVNTPSPNPQDGSASKIQVICTTSEGKSTSRQPSRSSLSNSSLTSAQIVLPQTEATHSPQIPVSTYSSNAAIITLIKPSNNSNTMNITQPPIEGFPLASQNIMLQPTSSNNLIQMRIAGTESQPITDSNNTNSSQESSSSSTNQTPLNNFATNSSNPNISNKPNTPLAPTSSSSNEISSNATQQPDNLPLNNLGTYGVALLPNPSTTSSHNSTKIQKSSFAVKNPNPSKPHGLITLPSAHNMITIPITQTDSPEPGSLFNEDREYLQPTKKKRKGGRPSSKNDRSGNNNSSKSNNNHGIGLNESKLLGDESVAAAEHNGSQDDKDIVPLLSERAEKRKMDNQYKERMKKGPLNVNLFIDQPSLFIQLNDYQEKEKKTRSLLAEEMIEKNNEKPEKGFKNEGVGVSSSSSQILTLQPFLNYGSSSQPKVPLIFTLNGQENNNKQSNIRNKIISEKQNISHADDVAAHPVESIETSNLNKDSQISHQSDNNSENIDTNGLSRIKKIDTSTELMDQTNILRDVLVKKFKSSNTLEGFNEPFSSLHSDFAASYLSPSFCKGVLSSVIRHQDFSTEDLNIEY